MLRPKSRADVLRVRRHAVRSAGSNGQGAKRMRHCKALLASSMMPAKAKTCDLYSLIQTKPGNAEIKDDSAAPAPSVTSMAGKAQQISVPEFASKVAQDDQTEACVMGGS